MYLHYPDDLYAYFHNVKSESQCIYIMGIMIYILISMMGVYIPVYLHYQNNDLHVYFHNVSLNSSVFDYVVTYNHMVCSETLSGQHVYLVIHGKPLTIV